MSYERGLMTASPTASSNSTRVLSLLLLGGLNAMGPLSVDTYLPALPTISHDLNASISQVQITLSACILGMALGPLLAGPISDALGRRRPLLIGLGVYVLVSLLCMVVPSVTALTALRFVQGVAGVTGGVIAIAIARDLYSGSALARCLALLMTIQAIGPIVAPVLGSLLLTFTSWHGIFVSLALISAALLVVAALGLRETLPPGSRNQEGVFASLLAFRELVTDQQFIGYALAGGFALAGALVYISGAPFILQNRFGVAPQVLGYLFGINGVGIVIMSQVSARLVGRVSLRRLLLWGLGAMLFGGVSMLVAALSGVGAVGIVLSFLVCAASLGLIMPNASALALANVRAAGSASALLTMLQLAIGALAAPLVGLGGSGNVVLLAAVVAAFGLAALGMFFAVRRPYRPIVPMQAEPIIPQEVAVGE
jgi:DHA1 family bicyclomycin/chloramphenicol resistance-like MFS transporter